MIAANKSVNDFEEVICKRGTASELYSYDHSKITIDQLKWLDGENNSSLEKGVMLSYNRLHKMFEQQFNCGVTCCCLRFRLMQDLGYVNKQIGYKQDFAKHKHQMRRFLLKYVELYWANIKNYITSNYEPSRSMVDIAKLIDQRLGTVDCMKLIDHAHKEMNKWIADDDFLVGAIRNVGLIDHTHYDAIMQTDPKFMSDIELDALYHISDDLIEVVVDTDELNIAGNHHIL